MIAPVQERIPIYLAAIGPKNTALAGEIADGWIPTFFSPEHVADFRAAARGGRGPLGPVAGGLRHRPTVQSYVSDDREMARNLMRPVLALYIGGMGSRKQNFYNNLVQRYGFEEAAGEIQDLYLDGKKAEAGDAIPDELIDMVSLCGPRDVVRDRLAAFRDAGVGTLMVSPMAFTAEDRIAQLRARGRARGGLSRRAAPCASSWAPSASPATPSRCSRWARELVAARPRGHLRDLVALARAGGGGRDALPGRAGVPGVPRPGSDRCQPYEAVVRATGRHAAGDRRGRARRRRARHPHPGPGAGRRARGAAGGHADPARLSGRRAGLSPLRARRPAAPHRGRPGAVAAASNAGDQGAEPRARRAQRRPAAGSACAPVHALSRRAQPGARAWSARFPSSSTREPGPSTSTSSDR